MVYNIFFEAAALAFLIVLNIYIRLQYNSKPLTNRMYKRLALVLLTAVLFDLITAFTISYAAEVPVWLNMILNFIYLCSDIVLEYYFVMYCMICVFEKDKPAIVYVSRGVVLLSVLVLTVNFATGWVYSFDENGYVHGPVYMLVHAVPMAAILTSVVILFIGFRKFSRSQRLSVIMYSVIVIVGAVVQMIRPDVLFTLFSVALGFMSLTFSLETPDYQALMETMDELRRARDEAEEAMSAAQKASHAKTEFLTGVSHEIRTPINAIIGFAEAIIRDTNEIGSSEYSGNILSAGKSLLSMVGEIMDYTELESDNFCLNENDYATSSFFMDLIACGEFYAEKSGIEFRADIAADIPVMLRGDSGRISQIINNLLSNAAKYTEKGHACLKAGWEFINDEKGYLSVSITDTGIGMVEEDVARISSSFLRMDKKHTQNIQGIGLGLAITTRLLYHMDSELKVESEYGKGTTVSFKILQGVLDGSPVGHIAGRTEVSPGNDDTADFSANGAKLLAVDDNLMNLEIILRILRETGAETDIAFNGEEALELIRKNGNYDMILIDHMMPVMDGIETLKIIKKEKLCPGVPVVVVTANAVSGEREKYLAEGFDDYVSKPVTSRVMFDVLRRHLPECLIKAPVKNEEAPEEIREAPPAEEVSPAKEDGLLSKLDFLDTKSGMAYCCDDVDFYSQILSTFAGEDKTAGIRNALSGNDLENYRILVHALKGTSRTIGAGDLSEKARKLEMAAREGDREYIDANTESLLEEYSVLLGKLKSVL